MSEKQIFLSLRIDGNSVAGGVWDYEPGQCVEVSYEIIDRDDEIEDPKIVQVVEPSL